MGTLKNQPRRQSMNVSENSMESTVEMLKQISSKCKISLDQAIKIYEIETTNRKIDAYIANGEIKDEQLSGLAMYLDSITEYGIDLHIKSCDNDCE